MLKLYMHALNVTGIIIILKINKIERYNVYIYTNKEGIEFIFYRGRFSAYRENYTKLENDFWTKIRLF